MKKKYYTIKYPFSKSVFDEKFITRTIPIHPKARLNQPYSSKVKGGRIFFGELVNDRFQIYTRPDMWDAILKPQLFIKRMPALFSFSRIYGIVHKREGELVVDCTTDKMELAKLTAIAAMFMLGVIILVCSIGLMVEGFDIGKLVTLFMLPFLFLPSFFTLRHNQEEENALIKFMEDLEN